MGTTANILYPYPELTDSANVPRDQKALAEAVERSRYVAVVPSATALPTAYPVGTSVGYIASAAGPEWPTGGGSTLVTAKAVNHAATQWVTSASGGAGARTFVRAGTSAAWGPWVLVADTRAATIAARGRTQITATSSIVGTATVTFPAGLFTTTPRVTANTVGSSGWNAYLPGSPGASGMQLGIRSTDGNAGTITLGVDWIAMEGGEA